MNQPKKESMRFWKRIALQQAVALQRVEDSFQDFDVLSTVTKEMRDAIQVVILTNNMTRNAKP